MTRLIAYSSLQIEEEDGHFTFLTQSGWPLASFAVKDIPAMVALLQIIQKECQTDIPSRDYSAEFIGDDGRPLR